MKWIRWDGRENYDTRDDEPISPTDENYSDTFTDAEVVCVKDKNWREIESGTLDLDDGKLHITLKPLPEPEKVPTFAQIVAEYFKTKWQDHWSGRCDYDTEVVRVIRVVKKELDREEKNHFPEHNEFKHIPVELARALKPVAGKVTCLTIQDDGSWGVRQCDDGKEVFGIYTFGDAIQSYTMCGKRIGSPSPANPYTKEAVDELMYSLKEAGYEFAEQNPTSDQMRVGDYRRIYNAFQALLRQREAANVT